MVRDLRLKIWAVIEGLKGRIQCGLPNQELQTTETPTLSPEPSNAEASIVTGFGDIQVRYTHDPELYGIVALLTTQAPNSIKDGYG